MKRYQIGGMLCLLFSPLLRACSAPPDPAATEPEQNAEETSLTPVTSFLLVDAAIGGERGSRIRRNEEYLFAGRAHADPGGKTLV